MPESPELSRLGIVAEVFLYISYFRYVNGVGYPGFWATCGRVYTNFFVRFCTLLHSRHALGLIEPCSDNLIELLPYLHRSNVTQTFVERLCHATFLAAKLAK